MGRRHLILGALALGCGCTTAAFSQSTPIIVGKWSDSRECRDLIDYRADGTYQTTRGDRGRWTLQGNQLTMRAQSQATLAVRVISQNEIEIQLVGSREGAVPGRSYRCRRVGRAAR